MNKKIFLILAIVLFSCNNEKKDTLKEKPSVSIMELKKSKQSKLISEILELVSKEDINRAEFKSRVSPLLVNLYDINRENHKILSIIDKKLRKETNKEAFSIGIKNLKKELKKINTL